MSVLVSMIVGVVSDCDENGLGARQLANIVEVSELIADRASKPGQEGAGYSQALAELIRVITTGEHMEALKLHLEAVDWVQGLDAKVSKNMKRRLSDGWDRDEAREAVVEKMADQVYNPALPLAMALTLDEAEESLVPGVDNELFKLKYKMIEDAVTKSKSTL